MGKAFSNYLTKALLLILILSFALWGMGDFFNATSGNYAIKVNKTEISKHEWNQLLSNAIQEEEQQQRRSLKDDNVTIYNIKRQLASDLETKLLLLLEAERLGIVIHDDTVKKEILKIPVFQKDKKFDQERFSNILKNIGMTDKDFIDKIKEDLSRKYLLSTLTSHKLIPNNIIQQFIDVFFEKRSILLMKISQKTVLDNIEIPNGQELKKIYEKHKPYFKTNEKRQISYVLLGFDNIPSLKIEEEKLKKLYEEKIFLFKEPEKRTVKQIVFNNNKDAKKAKIEFLSGKNFKNIALKYNGNLQNENLGNLTKEELDDKLSQVIFSLPKNEISDPIETPLGWNLFIVTNITPSATKPFSEVKEFLKNQYLLEQKHIELSNLVKQIGKETKVIKSLTDLAKKYNLRVNKITLDQDNLDKVFSHKPLSNFSQNSKNDFYNKTFDIQSTSGYSSLFPLSNSEFCLIQLNSVIKPTTISFDQCRDKVINIWKQDKMSKQIAEIINNVKAEVMKAKEKKANPEFNNNGVSIKKITITRDNHNDRVPNKLLQEIFETDVKSFTKVVKDSDGNYLIAYIESKNKPTKQNSMQYWPQAQFELTNMEQDALLNEYMNSIRGKYKVSIDQSIFKDNTK